MSGVISYIEPQQLAEFLRNQEKQHTLVVDVRGEDFQGGHIKGATNIDSQGFSQDVAVDTFIDQYLTSSGTVKRVVFHCMFSQQRGPRCANRVAKRLQERSQTESAQLLVLRGGFVQFVRMYGAEHDLVEDVDMAVWG
ncbi:hypothetical protein CEUSTIGMA_g7825.t1 [Chlamydomonas eustigma]|uniref:Rhodanese domain-containing protein n=1 Tax=Chlamydomonas eustigma TaxID=1157962 RepID=A0A250XBF1_9CHLO|nr:hypothetical protein CEUSTIGMA_g7825.t1 [Chlamydomonas eustigma]|eukprot:GAX80386.1 hypothetical protein CEUSTIGMA_g7825.t1 [Chlamydomonas eustigma]